MQQHTVLNYTERLVAQAVYLYWRKTIGKGYFTMVTLVAAFLIWLVAGGDRSWMVGLMAAVVLLGVLMPAAVYVVHYRNSMGKLRAMAEPVAQLMADARGFTVVSDQGTASMPWSAVKEVWCFDDVWLLLFSKAQFVTLPIADLF